MFVNMNKKEDTLKRVGKFLLDGNVERPIVLKNCAVHWPCSTWTLHSLSDILKQQSIKVRLGNKNKAQWEGECIYEMATLRDLLEWSSVSREIKTTATQIPTKSPDDQNPLMKYDSATYWCYADYKYMVEIFSEHSEMLKEVCWSDLGFEGFDGTTSTIWIGSEGANTPCHYDTYGCNMVLQIAGRKKWQLFPPHQTDCLYPTRIPFEESSVFSEVNVTKPDVQKHPLFQTATPYVVTLQPGDILFVPSHWWHYVQSIETSISINCWMDLDCDDKCRLEEAITRTVFCKFYDEAVTGGVGWLNPTEMVTPIDVNLEYINKALNVVKQKTKRISKKNERTQDDCVTGGFCGDAWSVQCSARPTGKRKMRDDDDDVLAVKSKKVSATNNEHFLDFFKTIGIHVEVVPCQDNRNDVLEELRQCASYTDNVDCQDNVDVKTILQCITHPRIVKEISNLLVEKFQ